MAQFQPHAVACGNHLLSALPPDILEQLLPRFTRVSFTSRQPLYNAGEPIETVFFPETGMASMVKRLEEGSESEVGIVGREGMLGLPLLLGVDSGFTDIMVQMPLTGLRMSASAFLREVDAHPAFRALLLRYAEAHSAQIAQTAVCNSRHGLEQRLSRWLLMARDRAESDELALTQDLLAMMLGVHRPSITVTAGILQRAGLIRYRAGRITVLDRASLEAASCECYAAVQQRFARLMGAPVC